MAGAGARAGAGGRGGGAVGGALVRSGTPECGETHRDGGADGGGVLDEADVCLK